MNKPLAFLVLFIALVLVNALVDDNVFGNFVLGMLSAVITLATRRYFKSDVVALAGTVGLGMLMAPYFLYLLWYALVGVYIVPASVATNYLVDYVNKNFITSIPSTFIGGFGAWLIEAFEDYF